MAINGAMKERRRNEALDRAQRLDRVIYFWNDSFASASDLLDKALCEQAREKLKVRGQGPDERRRAATPICHTEIPLGAPVRFYTRSCVLLVILNISVLCHLDASAPKIKTKPKLS
jgi:hypothetical protein